MQSTRWWIGAGLLALSAAVAAAKVPPQSDLVVHEWGTFLAMQGADGVTLDGMYHEEHALPSFVHARSRDQLRMPSVILKGETPVIYFYTPMSRRVNVTVRFPRGLWTQWYPQAALVGPRLESQSSPPTLKGGHITWNAELLPAASMAASLAKTDPKALWNYAREVDAAYVRTTDRLRGGAPETERCLFYRGLGEAPLPLQATSAGNTTLTWTGPSSQAARHLFVLRVEKGRGAYRYFPELRAGASLSDVTPGRDDLKPLPEMSRSLTKELAGRLTESGLYPKEALAMVHTWQHSYFETDGVRVLFVLPQAWTDSFIPMTIDPKPKQLVRVMVGRLELLTPERERAVQDAVRQLAGTDAAQREKAFSVLREQGRYVEPILRRVSRGTVDSSLREACQRLMMTPFVTELRASVNDPTTGEVHLTAADEKSRVFVRAQLASLLRDLGKDTEAREEASITLQSLRSMPEPSLESPTARHHLRAYARAMEGAGDQPGALAAYERFVRWGSRVKQCGGCHETEGPRDMAWFRDWWAGQKLAYYAEQAGQTDAIIAREEANLARQPSDTASQMVLAYLYGARGKSANSARMWKAITDKPGSQARAQ